MKPLQSLFFFTCAFCLISLQTTHAQNFRAVDDTVCIQLGVPFTFNVKDNDSIPAGVNALVVPLFQSNCVRLLENGELRLISDSPDCCGTYTFGYRYENCDDPACFAKIELTIKCPKPDCSVIDLSDYLNRSSSGNPDLQPACVDVCAESEVTFFLPNLPGFSYNWSASGGVVSPGSHPAEVNIVWGPAGTGNISITITDSLNVGITRDICVNILPKPTASFTKSATSICLGGSVTFTNTSTGGNSYYWDFGDGSSSAMFSPTHQFNSPGTYDVCLYVTKDNVDPRGNPLCCCTDTMCMTVTVDSLPGPNIYWISTLCAGDSSKYWTDAANCASYQWTVLDHNGLPLSFTGQGNDTICVVWGNGPFGTVTLQVSGCSQTYCDEPVTAVVPIISPTAVVSGPTVVCQNETATYTLPKWPGVYYDWQVGGGTVVSGQGTNVATIQWGPGPTGTITVNYSSPFLQGLPGHSPPDCSGTATLNVQIRPKFTVQASPSVVCVNSTSSVFALPFTSYNWTVSPAALFSGQGTGAININWTMPGTYTVTAVPTNAADYCNSSASVIIRVLDVPAPDSITGPLLICPGETQTYFGHTSASGTVLNWTVTGGTPTTGTGNSITVTWGGSGLYTLSLSQSLTGQPMCSSPAIQLTVQAKQIAGPLTISGPSGCINSTQMYSAGPAQHPDAMFNWTISPATAGSVVAGQGTPNIDVQWNNTPGTPMLTVAVTLCGVTQTHSIPVTLNPPVVPVITQTGVLCPGSSVTLDAGSGFSGYLWSNMATNQTITVSTPGSYTVKTIDANGCMITVPYQVVPAPGPLASISSGSPTLLCINPPTPASSTLIALTQPGNTYEWFCNGVSQGASSPTATTFTHNNTNVAATFNYWVVVTAPNGCISTSNSITVVQDICDGDGCTPNGPHSLSFTPANQFPNCNVVNFSTTSSNVTLTGWNFGDPGSNTNSGTLAAAQHTYTQAGCFYVELLGTTPGTLSDGTPANCLVGFTDSVCVPVAAHFSAVIGCSPVPFTVTFTNLTSILPGETISGYFWDFDGTNTNTSTAVNPVYSYASAGNYTVTLTVTLMGGCQATITQNVMVTGLGAPSISSNPNPPCAGQPVQFMGMATGSVISWLWNFGNGASNGSQSPMQTYLMDGPYTVTLTVMDAQGCTNSSTQNIVVQPTPSGVITPSTTAPVCAGQSVTLTAPAGTGYTYLWSDNSTGPTLTVTSSGTYSVQVTLGPCSYTTPAVTVTVLPPPPAVISGNLVICDMGCTTLLAPPGYSYQWLDPVNLILGQTGASLQVCSGSLLPAYAVSVTDGNGCSAVSPPVTVTVAVSPSFVVNAVPTPACEGTPSVLTISPVQANVVYSWSNGGSGTSITVLQAGSYTATGVDTLTGCSSSASAIVNPLPDLCLVPTGCYKACSPDTICGPAGLASYQWNFNGAPITGANSPCLVVTQSGSYSLTGTTAAGCSATSDTLILELMDCGCENLFDVTATPVSGDTCCWTLSYNNSYTGPISGLNIHTQDADFDFDLSSLHPSLTPVGFSPGNLFLTGASWSNMPQGALNNFIKFCLKNVSNSPQQIIFDWYDDVYDIVCSDTLELECPLEPDCLYLLSDSIYCENKEVKYTFTVCNPIDAAFSVGYILLQPVSPNGVTITPPAINASPAIAPGECRTYTVMLGGGTSIFGDTLCFRMLAHDFDPATVDTALCCSLDTLYCIAIPDCEPCDDIEVAARPIGPTGTGPCCFNVTLINNFSGNYFDGVGLCLITPGATFSTFANTLGSGWATISYSPTVIMLDVIPPLGSALPLGATNLPVLCINTAQFANPMLEIKWMQGDSVVCRDTVVLACFPPCGYFSEEEVVCSPNGGWLYQGNFNNTSPYTINQLNMVFTSPPGLGAYNQSLPGTPVPPGGQLAFSIPIGAPAMAGDSVCFTMAMHDTLNVECCNVRHCIELPECPSPCIDPTLINLNQPCLAIYDPVCGCNNVTYSNACVAQNHFGVTSWTSGACPMDQIRCRCDDTFAATVQAGFATAVLPAPPAAPFTYRFTPPADLLVCDGVRWRFRRFPITVASPWTNMGTTSANAPLTYTFAGTGIYQVCMEVQRTTPDGEVCSREVCVFVNVFSQLRDDRGEMLSIAPNPFNGELFVSSLTPESMPMDVLVRDVFGKVLLRFRKDELRAGEAWPLDLTGLDAGVYLLECTGGNRKQVLRVVKQ